MMTSRMRSPLGRALGLGSAKEGVEHWWLQRITAAALVPLSVWFVIAIIRLIGADIETVRDRFVAGDAHVPSERRAAPGRQRSGLRC